MIILHKIITTNYTNLKSKSNENFKNFIIACLVLNNF